MRMTRRVSCCSPPEVKYTFQKVSRSTYHRPLTSATLVAADYNMLTNFPPQSTTAAQTDLTRIGDTIMWKNLYLRYTLENETSTASMFSRVIIFAMDGFYTGSTAITNFWQNDTGNQVLFGLVNREVVRNVYYDKVHVINSQTVNTRSVLNPLKINLSPKNKRVVFAGGNQSPRDNSQILHMAVINYLPGVVTEGASGFLNASMHFYFTDS